MRIKSPVLLAASLALLVGCQDGNTGVISPSANEPAAALVPGVPTAAMLASATAAHARRSLDLVGAPTGGLNPAYSATGKITLSVDGAGYGGPSGTVQVEKPEGATVRAAFLASTRTFGGCFYRGTVAVEGQAFDWDQQVSKNIFCNAWADVTSLVKDKIDAAPAGRVNIAVAESQSSSTEGEVLAVVFDDPSQAQNNTVVLMFGAQASTGDNFYVGLDNPVDPSTAGLKIDMGLGISFGFQAPYSYGQSSTVDVNDTRLTDKAGGQDDGQTSNGALITVGGLDDSDSNAAGPAGFRIDDELYSLVPFLHEGDQQIHVFTRNPSNDDNIFFASFFMNVAGQVSSGDKPTDTTAPAITPTVTGTLGDNGWYTSDVKVHWEVTAVSSVASKQGCDDATVSTDTDGQTFTCKATSAGGKSASQSVTVKRDATKPTLSGAVNGTAGANGWFTSPVSVAWTASDNLSGVAPYECTTGYSSETTGKTLSCAIEDNAGNSASASVQFKIDTSAPVIHFSGATSYDVAQSVSVECTVADAISGVAAQSCPGASGPAYSFPPSTTLSASATNGAGLGSSGSFTFHVSATPAGLCSVVRAVVTSVDVQDGLCDKLAAMAKAKNQHAKEGPRGAFHHQVDAQTGKSITSKDAQMLNYWVDTL